MCSWDTTAEEVDAFADAVADACASSLPSARARRQCRAGLGGLARGHQVRTALAQVLGQARRGDLGPAVALDERGAQGLHVSEGLDGGGILDEVGGEDQGVRSVADGVVCSSPSSLLGPSSFRVCITRP